MPIVTMDVLIHRTTEIFAAAQVPRNAAQTVAQALVEADARGIGSHGVHLVPNYIERLLAGSVSLNTKARIVVDAGAVAVLDAENALGILTSDQAMRLAVSKAQHFGVGVVTVRRGFHFGAAFRYVQIAMNHGYMGIAASNAPPLMPAPGGTIAVLGNNPLAVGIPGPCPILLDMALSAGAFGKVQLAELEGTDIPPGWALDRYGSPTTDPAEAMAGLLLPLGGPKGYGLALVVDALTGVLSGGGFGSAVKRLHVDTSVPNDCAHTFLALNPKSFGINDFETRVRHLADEIRSSGGSAAEERPAVMLPGERADTAARVARREGVAVSASVLEAMATTAHQLGVSVPASWRSG